MKILTLLLLTALFSCTQQSSRETGTTKNNMQDIAAADSLAVAAPADSPVVAVPANRLIVPGKGIGLTSINEPTETAMKNLGKPDEGDAAMGKSMNTWFSKNNPGYKTQVYSSTQFGSNGDRPLVKSIRITNPFFQTANGLKPGSHYKDILASFNGLLLSGSYKSPQGTVKVYDDTRAGIAFEINEQNTCVGICVHEAGEEAFVQYLPFEGSFTATGN